MALSNYEKKRLFDTRYGDGSYTQAGTLYFALFSTSPGPGGGGVEAIIGTNGYARIGVASNATNFPAATLGSPGTNGTVITFPTPTGAWSGGAPLTHWGVFDASTGGNLIEYGELVTPITISGATSAPSIPIGGLQIDSA